MMGAFIMMGAVAMMGPGSSKSEEEFRGLIESSKSKSKEESRGSIGSSERKPAEESRILTGTSESDEEWRRSLAELVGIRVVKAAMEAGGCAGELKAAVRRCHPISVGENPADAEACARATVALRECMVRNQDKFRFAGFIRVMDQEIEKEERRRRRSGEPAPANKCWTGMRTSSI